jgi:type II secretion system protein J
MMKTGISKNGYTLLEMLIAIAIIVSIVSMVYAGFSAVSGSAKTYNSQIDISVEARKNLTNMARQLRCVFVPPENYNSNNGTRSNAKITPAKITIDYFSGVDGQTNGDFLRFITAYNILDGGKDENGLFDITYNFNKNAGEILISRQRFAFTPDSDLNSKISQTLMTNVRSVELAFFDGQKWTNNWAFKEKQQLPYAVKINILCCSDNSRLYQYETTANLSCSEPWGKYINNSEAKN